MDICKPKSRIDIWKALTEVENLFLPDLTQMFLPVLPFLLVVTLGFLLMRLSTALST